MGMVWKDDGKENDLPIGGHLWGGKVNRNLTGRARH